MNITCPWKIRKEGFYLFLILLLCLSAEGMGQSCFSLEPKIGYGTFRMRLMKEFQQEIIHISGVNAQATDQFPGFMIYGFKFAYSQDGQRRSGLLLERGSTGGRVAYADYSGSFNADQLLSYTGLGIFLEDRSAFEALAPFQLVLGGEAQFLFNKMVLNNQVELFKRKSAEKETFRSVGIGVQPYAGFAWPYKKLEVLLSVGYVINEIGQFHLKKDKNMVLDRKIVADWMGFRFGTSVQFKF